MAIEKEYLTTYGWTAKNAYFKIDRFKVVDNISENVQIYELSVFIYLNEQSRNEDIENPLSKTKVRIKVDTNEFDANKTKNDNILMIGYNFLKSMTRSFQKYSIDVWGDMLKIKGVKELFFNSSGQRLGQWGKYLTGYKKNRNDRDWNWIWKNQII